MDRHQPSSTNQVIDKIPQVDRLNPSSILVYFTGDGCGRNQTKKKDFMKNVKPKVNSFGNIGHVPGGGRAKVKRMNINFADKTSSKLFQRLKTVATS